MATMLYVKEDSFEIAPNTKILKAKDYAAFLKAHDIIAMAEDKARQIEEDARKAYEEEKKRGYNEGMEEGNIKISELMIDTVDKSVKNFEAFEDDVIAVVMDTVKKVLGSIEKKELVSQVVRNALEMVRNQKRVNLIVNPDDTQSVKEQLDQLLKEFPSISFIDVSSDSRVDSGGCKLETEMGVVDATIGVQLESIKRSITKAIK